MATGEQLIDAMEGIRQAAALALGSPDPKHWEAALQDVLDTTRKTLGHEDQD